MVGQGSANLNELGRYAPCTPNQGENNERQYS